MRLYIDLDTALVVRGPGMADAVSQVEFKLRDTPRVEVVFLSGLVAQELTAGATAKLGIKAAADLQGAYLALDDAWTKEGTGAATVYVFEPSLNTAALIAEFATGTEKVDAALEVEWTVGGVVTSTVRPVTARIWQDVNQGGEGTPLEAATPVEWLAANGMRVESVTGAWTYDAANGVLQAVSFAAGNYVLDLGSGYGAGQALLVHVPEASAGIYRAQVTGGAGIDAAVAASALYDMGGGDEVVMTWSDLGDIGNGWAIEVADAGVPLAVVANATTRVATVSHDGTATWAEVEAELQAEGVAVTLSYSGAVTGAAVADDAGFFLTGGREETELSIEGGTYYLFPTAGLYALAFDHRAGERMWRVSRVAPTDEVDVTEDAAEVVELTRHNAGRGKLLVITRSAAVSLVVKRGVRLGDAWEILQRGGGQGTVSVEPGLTLVGSANKTPAQYGVIRVRVAYVSAVGMPWVTVEGGVA